MAALEPSWGDEGAEAALTLDEARFRQVLGHFATGVTIVTTADGDGPWGFTCQAFTALSLSPSLVLFAPARSSVTWTRIRGTEVFCVNVLAESQEAVARVFATKAEHKFQGVGWTPGSTGSPVLSGVLAWVECRLVAVHDGGDHLLAVGRVVDLGVGSGRPLVFYRGGFGRFEA
ncbi:MAG: flavin reductase family protein [Acidimicrobiales bacterium]